MPTVSYLGYRDAYDKARKAFDTSCNGYIIALQDENAAGAIIGFEQAIKEVETWYTIYGDGFKMKNLIRHLKETVERNKPRG